MIISDFSRHNELFNPEAFEDKVTVIGAGATGSWLILALARLGIQNITVYDFDTVAEHNIPNQAFALKHIGMNKAEAIAEQVKEHTGYDIVAKTVPYTNQPLKGYVFCMVDSMAVRKDIWLKGIALKPLVKHYVEPRMGLELGRVYNVTPTNTVHVKAYPETLYGDENAEVSACGTSLTVVTSAMHIASVCARQLITVANGGQVDNEIIIDMAYNNLLTTNWKEGQ